MPLLELNEVAEDCDTKENVRARAGERPALGLPANAGENLLFMLLSTLQANKLVTCGTLPVPPK